MHASKTTIIFFLGTRIAVFYSSIDVVIVCANLTSNAIIFKMIVDRPLLINVCNDYRT